MMPKEPLALFRKLRWIVFSSPCTLPWQTNCNLCIWKTTHVFIFALPSIPYVIIPVAHPEKSFLCFIDYFCNSFLRLVSAGAATRQQAVLSKILRKLIPSSTFPWTFAVFQSFFKGPSESFVWLRDSQNMSHWFLYQEQFRPLFFTCLTYHNLCSPYAALDIKGVYWVCEKHEWHEFSWARKGPFSRGTFNSGKFPQCPWQLLCSSDANITSSKKLCSNIAQSFSKHKEIISSKGGWGSFN